MVPFAAVVVVVLGESLLIAIVSECVVDWAGEGLR